MPNHNLVVLVGNLASDIELTYLPDGKPVASFVLGVADRAGAPAYITIKAFNTTAENAHVYLTKGRAVLVQGALRQRTWKDGSRLEVVAHTIEYLDGRKET